ncbi:centrosomal protein of 295 kDa isoform X3 [Lontra canadensis]|uniref:centrosomal protein of 295 kDa isoform X3 n=1 Tax=Lontra canadensis TaxID=76717 RepID=UPI0013F33C58|nr:centrosomal protein of 295 kDa isoform X3 [Lontra canadensis]
MTEVTGAWRWLPRRRTNGCWEAGGPRAPGRSPSELRFLIPGPRFSETLKYLEMKRKVGNAGKLRLSPNEEAHILKEDYERRRKLRLLQVREQERGIALQIREDIKQRRNQQLTRLAEELRTEWKESQTQKIKNLEKLYLASLRSMGEGHQHAKENEPDLNALARRAAERRRKAEMRHKEALKLQKNKKEELAKQKTWHITARKEALLVEKERSAKITSLPPPPPALFENIELKRTSNVKTGRSTYHHLCTFVSRETDTEQPDPHLAAEEEAKRLEERQKQAAQERMEQYQKAHVRGFQAMKKIHLAQTQEKLMKELKQLQQEDLARRRQTVAQMPPQLIELPYKRSEMKEDWQRELEFAFEDMYNADRKVKGNLILHLEPEPLPTVTDQIQDEELDLSMEQESVGETENSPVTEAKTICSSEAEVPLAIKTHQVPSKILFKKLLNKIRSQKSLWTIKSMSEDESEVITALSETESKAPSVESGGTVGEERTSSSGQEQVAESDTLTIDSGPLTSEEKPLSLDTDSEKEQEMKEAQPITAVAQSSVLLHPQEEASRIRMAARQKQIMEIEEQKQKQLELLEQIERQKLRLETDCFRAQLEKEKRKRMQQIGVGTAPAPCTVTYDEDHHRQMIHNYQHQLLQQNRFHRQSVETARKRLLEYQTMLKGKYSSGLATSLTSDSVKSVLPQNTERPTVISEHWVQGQRPKLSPNKYLPVPSIQSSRSEEDPFQIPRQSLFPQTQVETDMVINSDVLAKRSLESKEQPTQLSQSEVQQRGYKLVHKDSHTLSKPLSQDRLLIIQDPKEIAEISRPTTSQTLDPQQRFSENKESIPSKLTERSSFQPAAAEHAFSSLPATAESGKIQESLVTMNKSTVSVSPSVISHMQGKSLPTSENITAHLGNLKALQEQLDLQKEVLRSRQEAQEQLLLYKQKELEGQTGLFVSLPLVSLDSFATLPSARAESGTIQESSPTRDDTAVPLGHLGVPQLPDRLWSFSQPVLSQPDNFNFVQEQFHIQRDSLQARREAQEVSCAHKQSELDGRIWSEQTAPPSLPSQVAQHTFTSLPCAGTGKIRPRYSSESVKGLLSSQSENQKSRDGSLSFLQQFFPLHDSWQLLREQVTTQSDALQARQEAQAELLLHRQRDWGESGQMGSSLPPVAAPCLVASQASAKTEPRRIQNFDFSEKESVIPSSHPVIPAFQDGPRSFPQHNLPRQENLTALQEQSHTHRVMLGTEQETREFVHKPHELEKTVSSEQTGTSLSLSQVAESERCQEFMPGKSDGAVPLSSSTIPRFQERRLGFLQPTLPLQDNLEKHQEWLDTEKAALRFSQKSQGKVSLEQTDSSFEPQVGQPSFTSLPSAESGTTQEPPSTESDSKSLSSHLQIPQLQDRLWRISQLIRPQQDNLKALGERLATQREAIIQSRQEAQEELLLHKQSEWKQGRSPEHVGSSFFSPPVVQHSLASLPLSESGRTQEPCSATSDNTASSRHSEKPGLPDRLFGLSQPVLPEQDHLIALQQEHLHARSNSLPCAKKTQKHLVLPRQYEFEEKLSSEHFVQLPHGDLKVLQEQLEIQRKTIRSRQEVQEELLLQRLSKLERRVSSEQISSSSVSQVAPPVADSERIQKPLATRSDSTVASSHSEISASQDRLPSPSPPVLPSQGILAARLDFEREVVHSNEKGQEELLNNQTKSIASESSEHPIPSLFSLTEKKHPFIPLPFAEVKSKNHGELYSSKNEQTAPSSNSMTPRLQDRLLCFSQPVLTLQDNLGLQKQLDLQKKVLHYSQKAQEELLVQRQTTLQQQVQKHQETLRDFFKYSQISKPTAEGDTETQKFREWLPVLQDLARADQEGISPANRSNSGDNQLLSEESGAQQSGEHLDKELGRRSSKPPVAKVKCGLDLNQHELSAIPEVESPASGRTSILGKPDFYQDRDPLRVSISREQSFFGSPLNCDAFGCLYPIAQEYVCNDDSKEAVKVKDAMAENHAVGEEQTYLSPTVKPDNAETEEVYHEPLSSVTVSTGSFLSYENTDLSLTDPGSFSELDPREQESTTGKEEERDILSSVLPSSQVHYQRQDSREVHQPLLPAVEKFTPVDLDFPELEHTFPNLHRQLFKPLEPHPDFDISSYSGISQDSRDFYQNSDSSCESHHTVAAPRSTVSFTALKTSLNSSNTSPNQQLDPPLAHAAAQIFATEKTEGSEQSFQQLLPEFSSQEGSQHIDLPSIFSIEARDSSQGMENQNYSEQIEMQNKKKSVHFHLCVGNLQSSVFSSSDEANVFHPLSLQYSTPCGSTSSECSTKAQPEGRKERLGFEELSGRGLDGDKNESLGVLNINSHAEEMDSQSCVRTVERGTSVEAPYSIENEKYFKNSTKTETPKIPGNLSHLAESELFLSSGSLQSSIPVWETESGHGIIEEPELTLVSTSDISIAEMDLANLTLEEKKGNEAKSSSQVSEFLPFVSVTETSDYPDVSEHGTEERMIVSAETPPKIIALPGSLQEAFIKRKKSFIERSSQRQKEIKNKIRIPENAQIKIAKEKPTGSSVNRLKGVNKVKVRVSLHEDRKTAQALMHPRALRSYNQLAEVKQQREEKAKQDAYAQNRARAKEFHKQTLEKLRAKNTC